jgi:tetratricopeptide (TPR) repeat protein
MKLQTFFMYLALASAGPALFACESSGSKSSPSVEAEDDDEEEDSGKRQSRQPRAQSSRPSETRKKGSITYAMTTLANEDSFVGQLPQPKLEDVLRDLESELQKDSDDGSALISYLVFRRLSGSSRDFLSVLARRGSTASSQDPWILIECSYAALLRNDLGMAQFLLDSAGQVGRGNAKVSGAVLHARGLMFYRQRKIVLAMAAFREAAKLNYEPAMLTLSFFALKVGDSAGALVQLNKLKGMVGDNINVQAALGIAYRQAGKSEEAAEALSRVLKSRPNDRRLIWNTSLAYADIPEKRKEAIALLERYSSAPGGLFEIDGKAQSLLSRLRAQAEEERNKAAAASQGGATGGTQ